MHRSDRVVVVVIAFAAVACSSDDTPAPPDGPPPPVRATVRAASIGCIASAAYDRFVINRADGSAVGASTPITAGGATVDVVAGDALTAANDFQGVQTILGVQGGDELTFGDICGPPDDTAELTVTWETFPGAAFYTACTRCNCEPTTLGGPPMTTPYACDDADPSLDDITVIAHGSGNDVIGISWRPDAPVSAGATVTAGPWQPATSLAITVDALPDGARDLHSEIRIGANVVGLRDDTLGTLPATITRSAVPVAGAVHVSTTAGTEQIVAVIPAGTPTWTLAVTDRLPDVSAIAFDPPTRTVSFQVGGGAGYDVAVVDLAWRVAQGDVRSWRVLVPPGVTSFAMPKHPAMPETDAPDTGQPTYVRVTLVERADLADYDAARGVPMYEARNGGTAVLGSATGLVRWTVFQANPGLTRR